MPCIADIDEALLLKFWVRVLVLRMRMRCQKGASVRYTNQSVRLTALFEIEGARTRPLCFSCGLLLR